MSKLSLTLPEYLAAPKSEETWLIEPVLPSGGTMLLYGDPKVGKSFAALQLAASLSSGDGWLGFRGPEGGKKTLYVQLDTPRALWASRLQSLTGGGLLVGKSESLEETRSATDQPNPQSTDSLFFSDRETLECWPFDILNPDHAMRLAAAADGMDVVILDTIREAHRMDENDSTAMQTVLSQLTAVVKPAALVLIAHGRKANADIGPSLINDNRGSNYVVGAVDAIVHFTAKGMQVGGRAIEEQDIKLDRLPNGCWTLHENPRDKVRMLAQELLEQEFESNRARARILAELTGNSEESCRKLIDRIGQAQQEKR